MTESISDVLSIITVALFAIGGLYVLFLANNSHHEEVMKNLEDKYYQFYDNADDESSDDDDHPMSYYE